MAAVFFTQSRLLAIGLGKLQLAPFAEGSGKDPARLAQSSLGTDVRGRDGLSFAGDPALVRRHIENRVSGEGPRRCPFLIERGGEAPLPVIESGHFSLRSNH